MSIGNRMRGLGESVYYLDDLKPKMDELMGDVSYELNHEVGKRKLLVRLDGFGEEYKPQIETLMDEELPVGYRMEYDPFPLDYIRLEFLEGAGTQGIYVPYEVSLRTGWSIKAQSIDSNVWSCAKVNRHTAVSGKSFTLLVGRSGNMNSLTLTVEKHGVSAVHSALNAEGIALAKCEAAVNFLNSGEQTLITEGKKASKKTNDLTDYLSQYKGIVLCGWFNNYKINNTTYIYRVFDAKISEGNYIVSRLLPALDPTCTPCMYDLVTKQPFYNQGTGQFIAGLTMKQALNLAKLPTPSDNNKLTISLPKEASLVQHNQGVNAALETAAEKGWNIPVQYRDEFDDKSILNKYAECVTFADIARVNPEFTEVSDAYGKTNYHTIDLTTDGDFPYNLAKFNLNQHWVNGGFLKNVFVDKFFIKLPALETATGICCMCKSKEIYFDAPKAIGMAYVFSDCVNLEKATFTSSPTNIERICMSWGQMVLREIYGDFTKVTNARQAFYNCTLNKESVLRICSELPTVSNNPITIGIHVDHQTDEEITEALTNLETKGWDVVVQWKGTPTAQSASTFGLRKPPIYTKIDMMERPGGTIENFLDWGHYVTNWEKNGYQEFASIEEAEEHFNIKKEITE